MLDALDELDIYTPNESGYPIIEVPLANHEEIDDVGRYLFDHGIYVTMAAYPLVPKDEVGFRIQVTAANTDEEIDDLIRVLGNMQDHFQMQDEHISAYGTRPALRTSTADWVSARPTVPSGTRRYVPRCASDCGTCTPSRPAWPRWPISPCSTTAGCTTSSGSRRRSLILVAVRMHKPEQRAPWYLFALGQTLFIAGDVLAYNYDTFFGTPLPYPAVSDALYLAVYPCLIGGMMMMIHRRNPGRDRASFIDSLMVSIGVGTISWVFLIAPYAHDTESSLLTRLTSISYPIMDLLLIAVAVRLAVGAGKRAPSFLLMMIAVMALFVTDAIYGWLLLGNGYTPGSGALEVGWIAFYVIFGMAALHPSMRVLSERAPDVDNRLTKPRLLLLAGAALMAPGVQAIQALRGESIDLPIVIGAAIALFLLAIVRMAGLVHSQEQSANRERALRAAGAALVTATNREGIYASTLTAAHSVAGEDAAVRICEMRRTATPSRWWPRSVDAEGIDGHRFRFSELDEWKRERLLERRTYSVAAAQSTMREPLGLDGEEGVVFAAPLFIRDEFSGLIVVAVSSGHIRAATDGLEALTSQVALALESAALTEDLLLAQSEKRFASLVQNASDIVTVIEPDSTIRYASPASTRVLGYDPEELEGTRFANLISPEDKTRVLSFLTTMSEDGHTGLIEFRARHKDGHWVFVETLRTNLLHDPNVKGIVLNTRDITERKEFEEQLSHQAFHDSVTGLANRALFRDRVDARARAPAARPTSRSRSCSSTSTTSRRSTTRSATPPATSSCTRSASA